MHLDFLWQTELSFSKLCHSPGTADTPARDKQSQRKLRFHQLTAPAATDCDRLGKPNSQFVSSLVCAPVTTCWAEGSFRTTLRETLYLPAPMWCDVMKKAIKLQQLLHKELCQVGSITVRHSLVKRRVLHLLILIQPRRQARGGGGLLLTVCHHPKHWDPRHPLSIIHIGVWPLTRRVLWSR